LTVVCTHCSNGVGEEDFKEGTKLKVAFSCPPVKEKGVTLDQANAGLLYLFAYLREKLNGLELHYLPENVTLAQHLADVQRVSPDIYGMSFTKPHAKLAYRTINEIKARNKDTIILCGGAHPTSCPEEVLDTCAADVCVLGEGEITVRELVDYFSKDDNAPGSLDQIAGIAFKREGKVIKTHRRPLIKPLDSIPFPAWDLIDLNYYAGQHPTKNVLGANLITSRGCPYDCSFCSNPVWKYSTPWLRYRSIENVLEEVKLLYSKGVREIYFVSEEVNFSVEWPSELCKGIIKLGYPDLYFKCNLRADKFTPELADLMAKANFWLVYLGIESANDRVLKGIGKHVTMEQVTSAIDLLTARNIDIFAFMMLYQAWEEGGQLAFETPEEVDNSYRYCKSLLQGGKLKYMTWQFAVPTPGSRMYETAKKYNLIDKDAAFLDERWGTHDVAMNLPGVPKETMMRDLRRGLLLKNYYLLKSGNVKWWKHLDRAWENLTALFRLTSLSRWVG
jgi:radical SAM superfamily enzyme YgiQ (UPF0313 family)